ncbi:hypothetical protein HELRODRAFT_184069 [Helobdella robusta]|uniref:Protein kinase domain-containing protein n=1 Tax=Helobdella robusta TaxID=6412 RepID=T1FKI8_HELRO|nr:hypothetical protein HELRODRAFT_184069 [Helobdella robusta]ESO08293.1 hypothetical protein HELRODRAFT_184069 [Helobdella robusta]
MPKELRVIEPYRTRFSSNRHSNGAAPSYGNRGTKLLEDLKFEHQRELERQSLKKFDLFIGEFELKSVLHKGSFGVVLLVKKQSDKTLYAIKLVNISRSDYTQILNEKLVLQKISTKGCSFLVKVFDYILVNGYVGFVMEYIPSISLASQVNLAKKFSEVKAVFYSACILSALQYLHSIYIFHRDITLRNILVDGSGYIKLVDFGVSQYRPPDRLSTGRRSTLKMDQLIDFEDLGRCTWELLTGEFVMTAPDYSRKNSSLSSNSLKYFELIFPKHRVTTLASSENMISALLVHPFYKTINWDDLKTRKIKPPFVLKIQLIQMQRKVLNILSNKSNLTLIWIPSRIGIEGTERVDQLPSRAHLNSPSTLLKPHHNIRVKTNDLTYEKWQKEWNKIAFFSKKF